MNLLQMLQQLKNNPLQILARKYKLPQDIGSDPNAIIQYLLNSGQISQEQVNNAMKMRNMIKI